MPDALIVGGGLAGAALATALAEAGRSVIVLERETGPHDKVCGEFLSREATLYLEALGVDPVGLGAERIDRVRVAAGDRVGVAPLPFTALSLSRRVLDEALLRRAAAAGAEIRAGAAVQTLDRCGAGWRARLRNGLAIDAQTAFLATGKRDLRDWARPPGLQADLIGFKQYWRLTPPQARTLASHVDLMLFPEGYAGLEPVEGGRANLCLLVRRSRFAALGGRWDALLQAIRADCPLLDQRLAGAEPCGDRPLAIAAIPYGHIARQTDGLWRLGDQAAVIPSFAGDGMSIALHSARVAANCFLNGVSMAQYQRRLARDLWAPVRFATMLSRLAVTPLGRALIGWGATGVPGLAPAVASATRVPAAALRRAGLSLAPRPRSSPSEPGHFCSG